jgi:HEAT repeat protein
LLSRKIGAAKKPNLQEIIDKIKSGKTDDRLRALIEIRVFQLKELLDIVIDTMLNDKSPEVRESAASTLDNLNDERTLQSLIQAIHDNTFGVRSAAGWGLVHLGDKVIPYMQEIIEKSDNAGAKEMAHLVLINL